MARKIETYMQWIKIFFDCQAALKALGSCVIKSGMELSESFRALGNQQQSRSGHSGFQGNEASVSLTREGAASYLIFPEPTACQSSLLGLGERKSV